MFIRNLYETRRMQYTIYNALEKEPSAWRDGKPLASVALTIDPQYEAYTDVFWPWRDSELEKLVHGRPNSHYYVEAWDYYHDFSLSCLRHPAGHSAHHHPSRTHPGGGHGRCKYLWQI